MTSVRDRIPASLRESLRAAAKEAMWLTVRHTPGPKPDIALFCSRRGGSTWLMETIGVNRGVLPLNQPVDLLTPNLTPYQYRRLPKFDRGQIIHPDEDMEGELRAYTDDLIAGRLRVNAPSVFWRPEFDFRTNRLLLKIVDAKPMMDWFDRHYNLDITYLVRHPVPQSLSCARNHWGTSTLAYTRNEWFVDEVLGGSELRDFAESIDRTGSLVERFVVNWVIENIYPLRRLRERPHWLAVSYEECVLDRERVLATVCERLGLEDIDRMRKAAGRASRSSGLSSEASRSAIRSGDREALVSAWASQIDSAERRGIAAILDRFGVTLYRVDSAAPDWSEYRAVR